MGFFKKIKKGSKRSITSLGTASKAFVKGDFRTAATAGITGIEPGLSAGGSLIFSNKQGESHISQKTADFSGLVETSPGKFQTKKELAKKKNAFDLSLNVARVNAQAEIAADEEAKRRKRRNNIITKPLGALASQASLTRVLTGQ